MRASRPKSAFHQRGRFITFEGGEGVGKSTHVTRLAQHLRARGLPVVTTREPGGTPRAEKLRAALLSGLVAPLGPVAEAAAFAAARLDHVDKVIAPALTGGAWVICDRFTDSTRAYQGARGGVDRKTLALFEQAAVGDVKPDLTLVLDLPAMIGMARAAARGAADRFEAEDIDFHEGLRQAFLEIAAAEPQRCVVVDAGAALEDTLADVRRIVDRRFFDVTAEAAQ